MKRRNAITAIVALSVLLLCGAVWAWMGAVGVGQSVPAGGWTEATPNVWGARLDDNAASTAIVAYVGSNGTLYDTNTSNVTSTDHYQGTRAFALTSSHVALSPQFSDTNWDDGTWTIQFAFKASTAITSSIRLCTFVDASDYSEDFTIYMNSSDTAMVVYWGGTFNTMTINDITTGAWQVVRVVIDTGATNKITVYQGADEEHLTSVAIDTSVAAVDMPTNIYVSFGGVLGDSTRNISAVSGIIDDLKIWNTEVAP